MPVRVDCCLDGSIPNHVQRVLQVRPGRLNERVTHQLSVRAIQHHNISAWTGEQRDAVGQFLRHDWRAAKLRAHGRDWICCGLLLGKRRSRTHQSCRVKSRRQGPTSQYCGGSKHFAPGEKLHRGIRFHFNSSSVGINNPVSVSNSKRQYTLLGRHIQCRGPIVRQGSLPLLLKAKSITCNGVSPGCPWGLWALRCPLCCVNDYLISAVRTLSTATLREIGDRKR